MTTILRLILLIGLFSVPSTTVSQDTCPIIVQTALLSADTSCQDTGRNQVCYGHIQLEAHPRETTADWRFETAGDIADLVDMDSMRLSPLDEESGAWGLALMKLQANLPDTLPGQNVTMLIFGDAEVSNAIPVHNEQRCTVTAAQSVNVRRTPNPNAPVVTTFPSMHQVIANGRLENNAWLRVELEEGGTGWVSSTLLGEANVEALPVVSAADTAYHPMQAFYFRSGVSDAACVEMPDSGILVQTPEGIQEIALTINEVQIQLASTAFIQAQPDHMMDIYLLEGQARIRARQQERVVPAGAYVSIPLDLDLEPIAPPSQPEPYAANEFTAFPAILDLLPRHITIAPPAAAQQIRPTSLSDESAPSDTVTSPAEQIHVHVHHPGGCMPDTVPFGMVVEIGYGMGYEDEAQANAGFGDAHGISVDGQPMTITSRYAHDTSASPNAMPWTIETNTLWTPPHPGTYAISVIDREETRGCTLTVAE